MFSAATKTGSQPPAIAANYIEDVFSTYLYTGNATTNIITNGIDLAGKGGLVWIKGRSNAEEHALFDSARGISGANWLQTNSTDPELTETGFTSLNSNGFSLGTPSAVGINNNTRTYASWTFAKQPKFFDVVTYTGTGTASQTVSHNLGSIPGMVIIKRTDNTSNWFVGNRYNLNVVSYLNSTATRTNLNWNTWQFDTTTFRTPSISGSPDVNVSGATYVAYVFAHNAGGFGLTGTDNVISCGSFSCDGANTTTVNLGYEPQYIMAKLANGTDSWYIFDSMRGLTVSGNDAYLQANSAAAESSSEYFVPTATGFDVPLSSNFNNAGQTYIYMAIRRGPMKVPTDATKMFSPVLRTTTEPNFITNFVVDSSIYNYRPGSGGTPVWTSRLLGGNGSRTSANLTEIGLFGSDGYAFNNGVGTGNPANSDVLTWNFQRAPSYFDTVCYTGTGSARTLNHNLTVAPELMIVKCRSNARNWAVYSSTLGATKNLFLDAANAAQTNASYWDNTAPTASVFSVRNSGDTNLNGGTFVAYLFATCAGVSKVGSYTGNGTTQAISCGFTGGARFVLIKSTDASGDWYVYDVARGMTTLTDPYLLMNSQAAEVATLGSVTTTTGGFTLNSTILADINISGVNYLFLAIA
jgi:hypothetical protein